MKNVVLCAIYLYLCTETLVTLFREITQPFILNSRKFNKYFCLFEHPGNGGFYSGSGGDGGNGGGGGSLRFPNRLACSTYVYTSRKTNKQLMCSTHYTHLTPMFVHCK